MCAHGRMTLRRPGRDYWRAVPIPLLNAFRGGGGQVATAPYSAPCFTNADPLWNRRMLRQNGRKGFFLVQGVKGPGRTVEQK